MPEVQTFLRDAWATTESTIAANDAERLRQEIAEQVEELREEIASEWDEIASGWKPVGITAAIVAGLFLVAQVCANLCNNNPPADSILGNLLRIVLGIVGCLGALVLGLAFWLGVAVLLVMVLVQIVKTSIAMARIAMCKSEIVSLEATRGKRQRSHTS